MEMIVHGAGGLLNIRRLRTSELQITLHSYHTASTGSAHLRAQGVQNLYAQMMAQDNVIANLSRASSTHLG